MKHKAALISTAIFSLLTPSARAANILELYDYHGSEVTAKANQSWLGLYVGKDGKHELKPAKVSITIVRDEIIDEVDPKQKTGKRISVTGKDKPIFVFAGISALKAGPVAVSKVSKKETLDIDQKIKLNVGTAESTLIVAGKKKDKENRTGYSVTLESGGTKQQLVKAAQMSNAHTAKLMWCGDLDGDGKLDLIMDTSTTDNTSDVTLFLSSQAKAGKLVKQVANQYATGC